MNKTRRFRRKWMGRVGLRVGVREKRRAFQAKEQHVQKCGTERVLLLDIIHYGWRLVPGREWWERELDGAHIHTLAHIFKAFG